MNNTKNNLILAAARLFAEKGYDATSIVEICGLADANIASINYHFGNKENLLFAALDYCNQIAVEKYPLDKKNAINAQDKLVFFVYSKLRRIFSDEEAGYMYKIISNINPTSELWFSVYNRYIKQHVEQMEQIIQEVAYNQFNKQELGICILNVMSVFRMLVTTPHAKETIIANFGGDRLEAVDKICPQMVHFMLAGIEACAGYSNV